MQVAVLYAIVVLVWGSTWAAIRYQLGPVAEEVSIAYRFGLAAAILFAYAGLTGRSLRIAPRYYAFVVLQGVLLYSANYFFVYYGTALITSGLIAVMFSLIVVFNALFERLFFGTPLELRLASATALGLAGIVLVFWPEVAEISFEDRTIAGLVLVVVAVLIASLGNMAAVVNTGRGLPVIAVNAHAMAWGSLASVLVSIALGRAFTFSFDPAYVASLLYLAVFGSSIAFGAYLALIHRIGSARAAYCSVLFPVVALAISTVIEDYRWTLPGIAGVALILTGNWLALSRSRRL